MNTKLETLIADSKIKPIGYAQMQPLLTYEPMVPMYSTKGEAQNGYEMVSLYSADQVAWILEEAIAALRQADQQAQPQVRELTDEEIRKCWYDLKPEYSHEQIITQYGRAIIAADRAIRQEQDKPKRGRDFWNEVEARQKENNHG